MMDDKKESLKKKDKKFSDSLRSRFQRFQESLLLDPKETTTTSGVVVSTESSEYHHHHHEHNESSDIWDNLAAISFIYLSQRHTSGMF